jgi:hypothetical protein
MKAIKEIIATVLLIFNYSLSYAQHPTVIQKAKYVFEGTIIEQKCYYGAHGIMTCSVFQIRKIFKGSPQIKIGTIKIINEQGGRVGNGPISRPSDAGPVLTKDCTYIIFGVPSAFSRAYDSVSVYSIAADNQRPLDCIGQINFHGTGASWGWRRPTNFPTTDSLYSFLKDNGLTIQEEVKQK